MLIPFIPPVTIGGKSSPVVANLFDGSGNFRQRQGSVKRLRTAVAVPPPIPKLDVGRIRDLLVKANKMAGTIRTRFSGDGASEEMKELARFNMTLLDLVSAVVEEGIIPMSSPVVPSFASVAGSTPTAPIVPSKPRAEPGTAELKAALTAAEKSAIVFDVDLGPSPVANRATLNGAFAAGLKTATLKVAAEAGGDANEAIRVVNDALSCADNVDFKGQTVGRSSMQWRFMIIVCTPMRYYSCE
jgi:hypothetical protein